MFAIIYITFIDSLMKIDAWHPRQILITDLSIQTNSLSDRCTVCLAGLRNINIATLGAFTLSSKHAKKCQTGA